MTQIKAIANASKMVDAAEQMTHVPGARYVTVGSVRGWCQHSHRSILAAQACAARDHRDCRSVGGYSDRVVRVAGGK